MQIAFCETRFALHGAPISSELEKYTQKERFFISAFLY